jgi:serine/threonine protein phosphatase PrpC
MSVPTSAPNTSPMTAPAQSPATLPASASAPATAELALRFALKSHPGRVRPLNEDSVGADPSIGLFVLADGLGGYNAGEVASTMAVSSLLTRLSGELAAAHRERGEEGGEVAFDPAHSLRETLVSLNDTIFRAALNSTMYEGMATTVVIAWFLGGRLWVAHAGDSRLYRLRGGVLTQVTKDHSFSQELLDAGMISEEEARVLPAKNLVTRAIGASPSVDPEVHDYDVESGDILLLCSDGLTEMVDDQHIGALAREFSADIAASARRLVDAANKAGGRDNTSVILVRVDPARPSSVRASDPVLQAALETPTLPEEDEPQPEIRDGGTVEIPLSLSPGRGRSGKREPGRGR